MKFTYNWLREYTNFEFPPEELATHLTMLGFEVEHLSPVPPKFEGVVVGKIVSIKNGPGHLHTCEVDAGERCLSIVCGAPNIRAGQKVATALEGARIADGRRIEKTVIKGQLSEGMICSEAELGISEETEEVMVLDEEWRSGKALSDYFKQDDDLVFEINVTPNRPDCLSILGIAREIATISGNNLNYPKPSFTEDPEEVGKYASVEVRAPAACPRYSARVIFDVKVGPSPIWLRDKLEAVGFRSINNVVDITNFVMLEMGHPLHAFDYDQLAKRKIIVQKAKGGTTFTALDEKVYDLDDDTLMICDAEKPVAIAGIIGGLNSQITQKTNSILLESAYFEPVGIRKSCKSLGIVTESSQRFERGADPNATVPALNRAVQLIKEVAKGRILKGVIDVYPQIVRPKNLILRQERVNHILGTQLPGQQIEETLSHLGFGVGRDGHFRVSVPTFRPDIVREIDLIEEIARVFGYDNIEQKTYSNIYLLTPIKKQHKFLRYVREILAGFGFCEVITNSMVSFNDLKGGDENSRVKIINPVSEEMSFLRTDLIPGLLKVVKRNKNRQIDDLKIFEIGNVFHRKNDQQALVEEKRLIAGAVVGNWKEPHWSEPARGISFYDVKGLLEMFFSKAAVVSYRFFPYQNRVVQSPSLGVEVGGQQSGFLGLVAKEILQDYDIQENVFVFELDYSTLVRNIDWEKTYKPIPKFPSIERDLALIVDQSCRLKN